MSEYRDWQVGDRVECIEDDFANAAGLMLPRMCGVYTIRSICADDQGVFIRLVEIQNKPRHGYMTECDFTAENFRKVQPRKTSIALLERFLNDTNIRIEEDA